jgi:hypothetical protein
MCQLAYCLQLGSHRPGKIDLLSGNHLCERLRVAASIRDAAGRVEVGGMLGGVFSEN